MYVVGGGIKWKEDDRDLVNRFLDDQSVTYTCGTDFSELASTIDFTQNSSEKRKIDKRSYRPFIPTYVGNLALCCMHPIEEKVYKFDNHKKSCYVCGDNSDQAIVANQFPLCKQCQDKGWINKSFTVIAKRKVNKKAKNDSIDDQVEIDVEDDTNTVVDNNVDNDDNDIEINDVDDNFEEEGNVSDEDIVESDLVVGSKKRSARSKKTTNRNFICEADNDFALMHGPGDFSSLKCNDFNTNITVADNKARNKKIK